MNVACISSCNNPLIKKLAHLKQASSRKKSWLMVAEGVRTLGTMSSSALCLTHLFFTQEQERYALSLARAETELFLITNSVLQKITTSKAPSGIVGVFNEPKFAINDIKAPGLVLADITDPGNMGTLIRSAVAFGAQSIVVIEGADVWGHKVIQASAGTIGAIPVIVCSWEELVQIAYSKQISLNALVVDGSNLEGVQGKNQLLVVGNEAHGLPAAWQQQCQMRSTIAMPGEVESLNVAVAGAIALYIMIKNTKRN